MKNLDLATLGVEEMNEVEMRDVDGGILWAIVAALAYDIISNGPDSVASFKAGMNYVM